MKPQKVRRNIPLKNLDKPSRTKEVGRGLKRPLFGLGAIAMCSAAATAVMMKPVGEHTIYKPQKVVLSDNDYAMMTWNMQGRAAKKRKAIKRLVARHSLDVIALQEVYGDDIPALQRSFKAWSIVDIPADNTRHKERGGYHNVLMTLGRVGRVHSGPISRASHFEQRSVALAELPAVFGETPLNVVVGTTHIGRGSRANREQFPEMVLFIERNTKDDASVLVCGDFNRGINTTQRYFGDEWSIMRTDNTTPSGHKVDFCLSQNSGDVTVTQGFVDRSEQTDHYPVVVQFSPQKIDVIGGILQYMKSYKDELSLSGIISTNGNTQRTSR